MESNHWDVVVVGGGAAGLLAAASAAEYGARVLLLEKNRKLGVKILMSGGTRCNITHHGDSRSIVDAFGKQGNFLHSALAALSPSGVVELVESQGVLTKVESTGKIFPVSDRAIDVRDALVRLASSAGAVLRSGQAVTRIAPAADQARFEICFDAEGQSDRVTATSVIVTTGGQSYPGCGTTGDGYAWAEQFGHRIVRPVPALVPILSRCSWANELKGITLEDADVQVIDPQPAQRHSVLVRRRGGFLFTHWGFSGPSVLDVSREVAGHADKKRLNLICDWLPDVSEEALLGDLSSRRHSMGKQQASNLLTDRFPKRLAEALVASAEIVPTTRNAELSQARLRGLVNQLKRCRFDIQGTLGFEKAEVTAGGVDLREVDSRTLQSKCQERLFFAGEVLDLDGPIGGFNFQSAFSTGWLAGQSAALASF